jgi:hypothetical protein
VPRHRRDFDDASAKQVTAPAADSSDQPDYLTRFKLMDDIASAGVCRLSVADLHRRCIALEDERRCLADEIVERRAAVTAECQRLIEREAAVIREIGSMLDRMQTASVTNVDDIAALVDLVLDIEFGAPSPELILNDRPWTLLLLRALRRLAPDVEMSWLRRQSPPGFDPEAEIFAPCQREGLRRPSERALHRRATNGSSDRILSD